jgi:abortive infection bacteriophage resistance protein
MKYNKPSLTIAEQIIALKKKGLIIKDDAFAESCLSNISYYRLRAYTYPFQDNTDPDHPFIVEVTFEEIIELYKFDHKLRLLLFDAIEKIEIAFRTQIIYQWAIAYGSHWQIDPVYYRNPVIFAQQISTLENEIKRSNETFLTHYFSKYSSPSEPPSWMSLEVSSMGLLSQMFLNLKKGTPKLNVVKHFGLNDISLLENWMHCFSNIRNVCAHHGRLWNRRLTTHITLPTNPTYPFIQKSVIYPYKLYPSICAMVYVINIVGTECGFKDKIKELMKDSPLKQEHEMGFPANWRSDKFWE